MVNRSFPVADLRLHNGRLLLTPEDPMAAAPIEHLEARLRDGRLIGSALPSSAMRFTPGARVFDYLGFTGCAVQFDQDQDNERLVIALEGPSTAPQLRLGRNTRPPRCPQCQQPLPTWHDQLNPSFNSERPLLACSHCTAEAPGCYWSWGRHGGFGRLFVTVEPVFPGEARPLPACFALLEQLRLGPWRYFFVQD